MLDIYTVSFFGHREIPNPFLLEEKLMPILHELINSKEYVEFLVGRDGDFDRLAASAVKDAIQNFSSGNTSLILVQPYKRAEYRDNKESFEAFYDEVQICEKSSKAHPKAAILVRNKQMIERSDLVICALFRKNGGAYKAVSYAETQNKKIINLCDTTESLP